MRTRAQALVLGLGIASLSFLTWADRTEPVRGPARAGIEAVAAEALEWISGERADHGRYPYGLSPKAGLMLNSLPYSWRYDPEAGVLVIGESGEFPEPLTHLEWRPGEGWEWHGTGSLPEDVDDYLEAHGYGHDSPGPLMTGREG